MLFEKIIAVVDPEPHSAALNMALDEALLPWVELPTLRLYGWRESAVSFGYFGKFTEAQKIAHGRELVRRWTGGGLVEHGADLTYTLIVPRTAAFFQHPALESYRLIHEVIAHWLSGHRVEAQVAPANAPEASGACFASHVRFDVIAGDSKLAGAAQRRTRWGLLHQGSIQMGMSDGGTDRTTAQGGLVGTKPEEFGRFFANEVRLVDFPNAARESAEQIAKEKYATEAWLRKR